MGLNALTIYINSILLRVYEAKLNLQLQYLAPVQEWDHVDLMKINGLFSEDQAITQSAIMIFGC